MKPLSKPRCLLALVAVLMPAASALAAPRVQGTPQWPRIASAHKADPALEARIARIIAGMTLAQKIGQMTQAEIKSATPDDVRQYYLGSILNGGGSWPNGNKHASAADWVALAGRYHAASMATDMAVKVPVVWGIDAIHGNSNVYGATLFPHNIGLGAARDPALVRRIGTAVGRAVRATGIDWVFAPTLAVVRDDRWGRTYESFSEDAALVRSYGGAYVSGLQANFASDASVIATAKHFIGDGGTDQGKDRGVNRASLAQMIALHAQGYATALDAGAQAVMVSFNSWNDVAAGIDYGKMHGSRVLITDVLKKEMGFDGLVVSDWNGIAEVPGCREDSCAQAVNAGIDLMMVPDKWKSFIANTTAQVRSGEIPMARIDDAVTRILRVKLRAGLFDHSPSSGALAGKQEALQARALAREAARASLVLLKNDGHRLPLAPGKRILVVGKGADSFALQSGGWSLTWQGTDTSNADFPNGETILAGIRAAARKGRVEFSADAAGVDLARFDAVIAVIGETPYAEGEGDIGPYGTLRHSSRYPEDLALLKKVSGKGIPVVTVLLSGRPLYVNDLLNLSDSFVAAWLPGTEGGAVADLLFAAPGGKPRHDFRGRLPFSWPATVCQSPLNVGDAVYRPLFGFGYGLRYGSRSRSRVGKLDTAYAPGGCGASNVLPIFSQADRRSYPLALADDSATVALGSDLNAVIRVPNASADTVQVNTQQDARRVTWSGPARLIAHAAEGAPVPKSARKDGALQFDVRVFTRPQGAVTLAMQCGPGCGAKLDVTALMTRLADGERHTVKVPLACFAGADFERIDTPFSIATDAPWAAAFANIEIAGGGALAADALRCDGGAR